MKKSTSLLLSVITLSFGLLCSSFTTKTAPIKSHVTTTKTTPEAQLYLSNSKWSMTTDYAIYLFVPEPDTPYPILGAPFKGMPFVYGTSTMTAIPPGTYDIVIIGPLSGVSVTFQGVTKTVDSYGKIAFLNVTLADGDYPGVYLN